MSTNPQTLRDLGAYWVGQGGVNLGVVGNDKHCSGYHLGRDRIYGACACQPKGICIPGKGADDYSVKLARDKAGLSNAASALDLGRLNGSLSQLYRFSQWLVDRCAAQAPGTADIREVIYSPDGVTVKRWSHVDGRIYTSLRKNADGSITTITPGNGDSSHFTHTHISFYRDSEFRDKRTIFAPFFTTIPDTSTEGDMPTPSTYVPGHVAEIRATSNIRPIAGTSRPALRSVPGGSTETRIVTCWEKGEVNASDPARSDLWLCWWNATAKSWEYTAAVNVTRISPPTADCTDAVRAATAPLVAQVEELSRDVAQAASDERERIAAAEAARIRSL